jgi:hypothetical protein
MKLTELMETIVNSDRDHWHKITCWGANTGPSYHERLTFFQTWEGQKGVLEAEDHSNVAIYIPDVSVTIAFGLKALDDFREDWANQFPDPHASSSYVDVFYNNALVFRDVYVSVDGGRSKLPLPRRIFDKTDKKKVVALEVQEDHYHFIRLVDSFEGGTHDFDDYFKRAGFKVVKERWPILGSS